VMERAFVINSGAGGAGGGSVFHGSETLGPLVGGEITKCGFVMSCKKGGDKEQEKSHQDVELYSISDKPTGLSRAE
jgi:hypothetical protein